MDPNLDTYKNLVDLLAVYSECAARLASLKGIADAALLETVDEHRADFADAQGAMDAAEKAIREIVAAHPEWLDGRTIATPYGKIRLTKTTKLVVANPDATIALIRVYAARDRLEEKAFIRVVEEPNLETLATLDDGLLAKLGISRVVADSIKVSPAEIDMGKATKATKETKRARKEVA